MKSKNVILPFITLAAFLMTGCATTVTLKDIDHLENSQNVSKLAQIAIDKTKLQNIRGSAIRSLGNIGNSQSIEILIDLLDDETVSESGSVFWEVVIPEGSNIKDPRYSGIYLTSGRTYVSSWHTAAQFEAQGAIVTRHDTRKKSYPIRKVAEEALEKATGDGFGQDRKKWRQWWEENKEEFLKGR